MASCRNVTSPISANARLVRGAAERGADRGGDGAVDAGEAAVGDHLAAPADLVARDHQVEVADRAGGADEQQPLGREGPADRAGDLVRREVGLGGEQRVEPSRRRPRRRPATPRASAGSSGASTVEPLELAGPRRTAAPPRPRGAGAGPDLDVVAGEQPGDRAGEGRVAEDDDPLDPAAQLAVEQQPVAAQRVRRRCGSRWWARRAAASRRPRRAPGRAGRRRRRRRRRCAGPGDADLGQTVRSPWRTLRFGPNPHVLRHPPVVGDQRVVELDVEVQRARRGAEVGRSGSSAGGEVERSPQTDRRCRPGRWSGWRRCRAAAPAGRR